MSGYSKTYNFTSLTLILNESVADIAIGYYDLIVMLKNSTVLVAGTGIHINGSGFQQVPLNETPVKVGISQNVSYIFTASKKIFYAGKCTIGLCLKQTNSNYFTQLLTNLSIVDAQFFESNLVVKAGDYWYGVGNNYEGQLCKQWTYYESSFTKVNITGIKQISFSNFTSVWLTTDNKLLYCGDNPYDNTYEVYAPTNINTTGIIMKSIAAQNVGCMILADDIYILGLSINDSLGVNSTTRYNFTKLNLSVGQTD